jgi:hypothetical protein
MLIVAVLPETDALILISFSLLIKYAKQKTYILSINQTVLALCDL